jgi:hypothetical protein
VKRWKRNKIHFLSSCCYFILFCSHTKNCADRSDVFTHRGMMCLSVLFLPQQLLLLIHSFYIHMNHPIDKIPFFIQFFISNVCTTTLA